MSHRAISWLLGIALVGSLVAAAVHLSEAREFVGLFRQVESWWLVAAILLQVATYLVQAEVFGAPVRAAGGRVSRAWLAQVAVAKLFVDQALPSAGLSGTALLVRVLETRGLPRPVISATAALNIASYHAAYVIALLAAMAATVALGEVTGVVLTVAALFVAFATAVTVGVLALSGRGTSPEGRIARVPALRETIGLLRDSDPKLSRSPALLVRATAWQLAIVLLDAATMWALIRALGASASVHGVFVSFMIASLFRTMGILPGGLGTYDVTSVLMLKATGLSLAASVAATLLFRLLSFWLPMIPGFWLSRILVRPRATADSASDAGFWFQDLDVVMTRLSSGHDGLSSKEAAARLERFGPNEIRGHGQRTRLQVLTVQLRSPLMLLLVLAAVMSLATGQWVDASIVLSIVLASAWIGYSREYGAEATMATLRARVRTHTIAIRDGSPAAVPVEEIVPGDVVSLSAGNLIPGDGLVVEAADFFVSESTLTGESYPVEKVRGITEPDTPLSQRTNAVFLGTNVRSGTARCLIVSTGLNTEFGRVARRLSLAPPTTEFERGIRRFGYLLTTVMLALVLAVFAAHVVRGRPPVETLLFAVALAVGLSPELLPAILSINLTRGARAMSRHGVLVRRLNAIENLGSMDVLCTDKTGTLTEGVVRLEGAYAPDGTPSADVLALGTLNARLETGISRPLDDAILEAADLEATVPPKLAEIPFDAIRKRISVIVGADAQARLITKGAFGAVLDRCDRCGGAALDDCTRAALSARADDWARQGIRVLAVATCLLPLRERYSRADETGLEFVGFLTFLDRPKGDAAHTIAELARLGVAVKVITGDSALVARHVAGLVTLPVGGLLTGADLRTMPDEALWATVEHTDIFAEVDPNQKERIITALRKRGHVVGFLGDGVNDAPAMHAADTSLSVEEAVDVARTVADFVLLDRDLDVIRRGIEEGRRTFANTMKYVLTTTSANLGNMMSMAAASLFLPFLPLLASQILLNNFLSDIPAVGIADDSVDPELVARPERWDMRFIGRFMVEFGLLSSLFDVLTFVVLLVGFAATPVTFRTAWFIESLLTELLIALVVRTRRPLFRSRPGRVLLATTVALVPLAFAIPFLPYASLLGFAPISGVICLALVGITMLYVAAAEAGKRRFYQTALGTTGPRRTSAR